MAAAPATAFVTSNLGLVSALLAIEHDSSEVPVSILWTNLCATFFPTQSGFRLASKESIISQDGTEPNRIVLQIKMTFSRFSQVHTPSDFEEKQIFIVDCRRPDRDTPPEWRSAARQLQLYCERNVDKNGTKRIFAATAIGIGVKFWKYDASPPSSSEPSDSDKAPQPRAHLTPLHDRIINLLQASGRDEAEKWLRYVVANGWAWATSGAP
ncbi:hypothetical protein VTN77DRAFT_6420 [Rasamsonia byssochlamydoides]|uniref:uncharacterized protein n=1 Tax=Rasamsonia byssochlamydoides TaxID=89139 RepID=UPI0037442A5D